MAQLINRDNESWGLPMYIYVAKCEFWNHNSTLQLWKREPQTPASDIDKMQQLMHVIQEMQPVLARSLHASQSNGSHSARLALALMLLTILFAATESSQRLSRCSIFEYLNAVV